MAAKGMRMGKLGLLAWLAAPVMIVTGLWFSIDRGAGKPDPRLEALQRAQLPGQDLASGRSVAAIERELAETEARKARMGSGGAESGANSAAPAREIPVAAGAAASAEPKLVQPESLEQGFIIVVEDKAKRASADSPIYMPSSHNGWNPGDPAMKLERRSDMRWQIVWSKPVLDSRVAFKFARGSWELVETTIKFEDIDNRLLPMVDVSKLAPGEKPVIELSVEAWRDQSPVTPARVATNPYRPIEVSAGSIRRLEVTGGGAKGPGEAGVGAYTRDLLVWLPPGYDDAANATKSYPVLYLQDGQNMFDQLPGVPGEWKVDETAGRLIGERKIEPLIIVGIPSAGVQRANEYLPVAVMDGVEPRGDAYIEFLMSQVLPRVERAFRVKTGPSNTFIGGSSFGAVISLEAATRHPEVFGGVLLESLPMLSKDKMLFKHFATKTTWPNRLYFGMGGKEAGDAPENQGLNQQYAASTSAFADLLRGKGFGEDRAKFVVDNDGYHNEPAWAERFGPALEWLMSGK